MAAWAKAEGRRGEPTGKGAIADGGCAEAVTGEHIFARSPLVKFHCRPAPLHGMVKEKPKAAQPPGVEVLRHFEHLITSAPTAAQSCFFSVFKLVRNIFGIGAPNYGSLIPVSRW